MGLYSLIESDMQKCRYVTRKRIDLICHRFSTIDFYISRMAITLIVELPDEILGNIFILEGSFLLPNSKSFLNY